MNLAAELARVAELKNQRPSRARLGTGKGVIVKPLDKKPRKRTSRPMWSFDVQSSLDSPSGKRGGLPRGHHDRQYRTNHPDKVKAAQALWRERNRAHVNAYSAMKNAQYRAADPKKIKARKRNAYWDRKWLAAFLGYLGLLCT